MPIVSECGYPGCGVKTIGTLCVEHDLPVKRTFPRGRAYRASSVAGDAAGDALRTGARSAPRSAVTGGSTIPR